MEVLFEMAKITKEKKIRKPKNIKNLKDKKDFKEKDETTEDIDITVENDTPLDYNTDITKQEEATDNKINTAEAELGKPLAPEEPDAEKELKFKRKIKPFQPVTISEAYIGKYGEKKYYCLFHKDSKVEWDLRIINGLKCLVYKGTDIELSYHLDLTEDEIKRLKK